MVTIVEASIAAFAVVFCTGSACAFMRSKQLKHVLAINASHKQEVETMNRVYEQRLAVALQDERKSNQLRMRDLERHWSDRLATQTQAGITVQLYPFVTTTSESNLFSKQTKVEVGYKYQLLVQGLPCFDPHVVVVETEQHKVVNEEMVELLKSKAVQFAEAAVSAKASGGASTIFSIAKAAIQRIK